MLALLNCVLLYRIHFGTFWYSLRPSGAFVSVPVLSGLQTCTQLEGTLIPPDACRPVDPLRPTHHPLV